MLDLFSPEMRPEAAEPPAKPEIRNADGKRATMLARLKAGPLSTFEAERLIHRGQATIGDLRSRGHVIDLVKIDGADHYVWLCFAPKVEVTKTMQEAYYATEHWKRTSLARKELDGFTCQQCGSADELETHHWRYNLFAESIEHDLITFCRGHHQAIHETIRGSEVHFPRFVTQEIAARLCG